MTKKQKILLLLPIIILIFYIGWICYYIGELKNKYLVKK
jgi:hypothetical protein